MDAQTNDSVLEENPLSLPIKKEDMHETGQQEYSFVHLAKTDDDKLTIFKQSMDAQTDSSFLDEDPLSSSIKQEIKHETERTVHLIAPVAMIDDKLTTSRQQINLVQLKEEPLDIMNGDIEKDPLAIEKTNLVKTENFKVENEVVTIDKATISGNTKHCITCKRCVNNSVNDGIINKKIQ
ncbi:uncharacterized protein LOC142333968 [Lycorma delicatula]|uniref:uncharacterized protein LOC142333968 n=1 Tax=Lycorma delicatula TaxID=130591 RepID=UPI003F51A8F1